MSKDDKNKKLNQQFKTVYGSKIVSATWERDGMEVSNISLEYNNKITDHFQKR